MSGRSGIRIGKRDEREQRDHHGGTEDAEVFFFFSISGSPVRPC
jgi:hypothetical protein